MTDEIIILNGSDEMKNDIVLDALAEIDKFRPIDVKIILDCKDELEQISEECYSYDRGQVDATKFLNIFHNSDFAGKYSKQGKLIILDHDLYDGSDSSSNWFFGGLNRATKGLGYITLSTARLQDTIHAKDLVRHELGHMFNAPSNGRKNTYELLGLHCSNNLCVMQQKDRVDTSIKYAHLRARLNAPTFCSQCEQDIINFVPVYEKLK